jgi:hypothetical protein
VHRTRWYAQSFGPRRCGADDRIEAAQVERFESAGIEWRQRPEVVVRKWNAAEIGAADAIRRKQIADDALVVERRIDRRLGPSRRDVGKDALCAAALI